MATRNNLKVAQKLREDESLNTRKRILKTTMANSDESFQALAASTNSYAEKLEKLNSFKQKSKQTTKSQSLKLEWIKEKQRLEKLLFQTEQDVSSLIEVLILHSPEESQFHELVKDVGSYEAELAENTSSIKSQLKEYKKMASDVVFENDNRLKLQAKKSNRSNTKSVKFSSNNEESCSTGFPIQEKQDRAPLIGEDGAVATESVETTTQKKVFCNAVSVFADILLQLRLQMLQRFEYMREEESELFAEILTEKQRIISMTWEERQQDQNERLRQELSLQPGDDQEVLFFMEEWFHRLNVLDHSHSMEEKVLLAERNSAIMEIGLLPEEKLGGWTGSDHDIFTKVWKESRNSGMKRQNFSALLTSQLPNKSQEEICTHEEWYRIMVLFSTKKKEAQASYDRNREELLNQSKLQLKTFRESLAEERSREESQRQHEANRSALHQKLQELQLDRATKQHQQALADLEAAKEAERIEAERRIAEQAEVLQTKAEIAEYKLKKQSEEEQRLEQQKQQLALQEAELKRQIEIHRVNVEQRENARLEKIAEKRNAENRAALLQEKRAEMLMKLAEQVPYFEEIQNIESKLDHITASVKGHHYIPTEAPGRGFGQLNGFTDLTVIKDARFRLAAAFRSAGVMATPAARSAMNAINPRPQLAIHGIL